MPYLILYLILASICHLRFVVSRPIIASNPRQDPAFSSLILYKNLYVSTYSSSYRFFLYSHPSTLTDRPGYPQKRCASPSPLSFLAVNLNLNLNLNLTYHQENNGTSPKPPSDREVRQRTTITPNVFWSDKLSRPQKQRRKR